MSNRSAPTPAGIYTLNCSSSTSRIVKRKATQSAKGGVTTYESKYPDAQRRDHNIYVGKVLMQYMDSPLEACRPPPAEISFNTVIQKKNAETKTTYTEIFYRTRILGIAQTDVEYIHDHPALTSGVAVAISGLVQVMNNGKYDILEGEVILALPPPRANVQGLDYASNLRECIITPLKAYYRFDNLHATIGRVTLLDGPVLPTDNQDLFDVNTPGAQQLLKMPGMQQLLQMKAMFGAQGFVIGISQQRARPGEKFDLYASPAPLDAAMRAVSIHAISTLLKAEAGQ